MDLARDGGAFGFDGFLQVFGQLRQVGLGAGQLFGGKRPLSARMVDFAGTGNDVRQPEKLVLQDVIGHSQTNRVDRCGFANGPREQDEGRCAWCIRHKLPRVQCGKTGQLVIREQRVERVVGQCRRKIRERVHMAKRDLHAAIAQGTRSQPVVGQRVLQMENAQWQRVFNRCHKQAIIGYKLEQTSVFARLGRPVFSPPIQALLAIANSMRA